LQAIMQEIVRGDHLDRVHVGLDFFDASINRVAAWAIGTRNSLRALLLALLEPRETMQEIERQADYTTRLALMEELKAMPHAAVWDYHCLQQNVPVGMAFMQEIRQYEKNVQSLRD
jgi:L-rhamnose isomerase